MEEARLDEGNVEASHTRHVDVIIHWSMLPRLARARPFKCHRPAINVG
jgi:hypothetical protein